MKKESVAIAIFQRGEILLVQRRDVPVWVLPGGGIEPKETPEEAAIREVKEETGFSITLVRKVGVYLPINKLSNITHLYEGKILSGKVTINAETKKIALYPLQKLPKLIPPPFREWIFDTAKQNSSLITKKLTDLTYLRLLFELIRHPILVLRFLMAKLGKPINS